MNKHVANGSFRWLAAMLLACAFSPTHATVVLPRVLGHNMVLQREKPVAIWGTAAPGEAVLVQFAGQNPCTVADANGRWQVTLKPLAASATPADLTIKGTNTIRLHNILVGEVWLCSGQSNMEYTMRKSSKVTLPAGADTTARRELERAHDPAIRIFLVDRKTLAKPDSLHRGWSVAQDSALRSFSAPAYFFAKELHQKLGVPVGVVASSVPGSRIEPWIAAEAFQKDPTFANQKVEGDPAKFYDPMIRPLAPFALKGFLWYQGESNCFLAETTTYTQKMRLLIQSWRTTWQDANLPFYYVSLAPFKYSESKGNKVELTTETLPRFREAQDAVLQLPHTGVIVTTDLATNLSDIHPPYKWEIGRRLALLALAATYRQPNVPASPVYRGLAVKGSVATISFTSGTPLVSHDSQPLTSFTIAGADGIFVPAQATIKGQQVLVSAAQVPHPVAVRFGWDEAAQPNLFSASGLPARPFRTDQPKSVSLP